MTSATTTLVIVAQQILIYGGLLMILIGMFGSLMTILVFSRRPLSRNPCSIYISVNGVLSFFILPLYFLPNIVTFGFQINWLALNTPFCKFQMSYGAFTVTSIFVINCFISFDRYAMSSRSIRTRALSSKKMARILICTGLILVWCLIGTPAAILFENVPSSPNGTSTCTSRSTTFLLVAAFVYYPIIEGVLPIILAIFFWYLTRRHIHSLQNEQVVRRFDKQITRMYLFQIMINAIASFPFAVNNLYRSVTIRVVRTQTQEDIVQFVRVIAIWIFYIQYCSDFYIYIITSHEIRSEAKRLLHFRPQRRRFANRVAVVQALVHTSSAVRNQNNPINNSSGQRLLTRQQPLANLT
jgi:hypothetical protein